MMIIVFPSSWHDNTMLTPFPFFHGATLRKWWDQATGNGHSSIFINIITIFVRVINIFRPLSRGKEGHRIHFLQVLKQVFCCWAAQEMGAKLQSRAECGFTQAKGCRRKIWIICRNLTSSGILVNNLSKYLSYLPFANWDFWSMTLCCQLWAADCLWPTLFCALWLSDDHIKGTNLFFHQIWKEAVGIVMSYESYTLGCSTTHGQDSLIFSTVGDPYQLFVGDIPSYTCTI